MKEIIDKVLQFIKRKQSKEHQATLKFVIIEICGDRKAKIRVVDHDKLPRNLHSYYAFELEDTQGNKFPAFLVVRHNLEPIVDIPIIKLFLEENRIIPIDISNLFRYKVEEMKLKMYQAFELVKAGEWGRFAFEKQQEIRTIKLESIVKFLIVAIVGLVIFFVISKLLGLGPLAQTETIEIAKNTMNVTKIT